ncbi:CRISPR-associated endonuclease Cas2 [Caryophanon latum]|uniref:CRISPR-associated endoribonuclease Cas2 n=1 Tax=Caryophanon latum TaxID=33977 RepID=A0A1C0YV53_9BACL|nr:CRISPR-associated endonuclease Cas2 [Caryophanon latum]
MSTRKRHYIICYDISDGKKRQRVSKLLLNYGTRVQKSVFELYVTDARLTQCVGELRTHITDVDSVRIYNLGVAGAEQTLLLGNAKAIPTPTTHLII